MGDYKHDMKEEKRPPSNLPEGKRLVRINELLPDVSKQGNSMYVASIEDVKLGKSMQVWLVAEPKKRWLLKSLLTAVDLKAGEDGVYDWSVTDVIGKLVFAVIEHETQPWVNREGKEIMQTKAKVTEFLAAEKGADGKITPEDIAWEE